MQLKELDYGHVQLVTLKASAPIETLRALPLHAEVTLRRSPHAPEVLFICGEHVFQVQGKAFADCSILESVCDRRQVALSMLVDCRPEDSELLVRMNVFPEGLSVPRMAFAIQEALVDKLRRPKRVPRDPEAIARWLSDECLIPHESGAVRALMSAGKRPKDADHAPFLIHGRTLRVQVVHGTNAEGEEILRVETVLTGKGNPDKHPLVLAMGDIAFHDATITGILRAETRAQLSSLMEAGEGFMSLWERYRKLEADVLLKRTREVGAFAYTGYEALPDGEIALVLEETPDLAERLGRLKTEDDFGLRSAVPSYLQDLSMTWDQVLKAGYEDLDPGEIACRLVKRPASGQNILELRLLEEGEPPAQGIMHLSISGTKKSIERRQKAQEKIQSGECPMPFLGRILENLPMPAAVSQRHEPITPAVSGKIFRRNPPTLKQAEAIRVALNTPDIALIQGPPGTGKTTVITAIVERLNEMLDNSSSVGGEVLLSGFQHDAVDNAIGRIEINGLPSLKFGGRNGEMDPGLTRVAEWVERQTEKVRAIAPPAADIPLRRRLRHLAETYALAPVPLAHAIRMLEEVIQEARDLLPPDVMDRMEDLAERLAEELKLFEGRDPEHARLLQAVRAVRFDPESWADDGPQNAFRVLRLLRQSGRLEETGETLLERAADWQPGDAIAFLESLADWRHRMLVALAPPGMVFANQAVRRQDVQEVLSEARDALDGMLARSGTAVDRVVADYLYELENHPGLAQEAILAYSRVFAATCQQSASGRLSHFKPTLEYDTVIVDEAARANPLDLFIPMTQARRRIILVGDHRQLPHIIDQQLERELESALSQEEASESLIGRTNEAIRESLFEKLFRELRERQAKDQIPRVVTLDEQYRMHPVLGDFVSRSFYESQGEERIRSGLPVAHFAHDLPDLRDKAAVWLEVPRKEGEETPGRSKSRRIEAELLARHLKRMMESEAGEHLSFGVISFYSAQVTAIQEELCALGLMDRTGDGYELKEAYRQLRDASGRLSAESRLLVGTVDAFQGREFDVVYLSMVRSNGLPDQTEKQRRAKYGHLMSPNRMCVCMSRQKKLLIVVGDPEMLAEPHAPEAIGPMISYHALCKQDPYGHIL